MVEVSEIEGIDIDEAEDFLIADAVFNYWREGKKNIAEIKGESKNRENGSKH